MPRDWRPENNDDYYEDDVMRVIIKEGNDNDDHDDKIERQGNEVGSLARRLGTWGFVKERMIGTFEEGENDKKPSGREAEN